ncbi:MAG: hypothetical protein HQ596_03455 [Candidatus Saganbacteria bacterium]|nr:hypothetical protein [Candidatus Saganbacteria bacterium]
MRVPVPRQAEGFDTASHRIRILRRVSCSPFDLTYATVRIGSKHALNGTKFLLAPSLSNVGFQIMHHLRSTLTDWKITSLTDRFCRVRMKFDGETIPLILSRKELCMLSKVLEIEVADLCILVLKVEDGILVATDRRIPRDALLNSEIRARIYDYLSGASNELPPPLFVQINEKGEIYLCDDTAGQPIYIPAFKGEYVPNSFAHIEIISRTHFNRTLNRTHTAKGKPIRHEFSANVLAQEEKGATGTPSDDTPTHHATMMRTSKWIFNNHPPISPIFPRDLKPPGRVHLCNKSGTQILLNELEEIYALGLRSCTVALQVEDIEGEVGCKTVRLYHPKVDPTEKPDHWFALYEVYQACEEGDLLDVRPEFARKFKL